ncbi:MAG: hypothetical protein AAB466_04615 [Verrucomicrobiota bacterium]
MALFCSHFNRLDWLRDLPAGRQVFLLSRVGGLRRQHTYPDDRPQANLRLEAKDQSIALGHGGEKSPSD